MKKTKKVTHISIFAFFLSSTVFAQDLNIDSDGLLYISPTAYVYAGSNLDVDPDGDLIMDSVSNDFSDLYVNGTSAGNAEYRRFTASTATRDLVSPPVSGQTFSSFASDNSGKIAAGTITPGNLMYGPFNAGVYAEYAAGDNTPLVAARGYRAGTVSTSDQTLAYKGTVNTADVGIGVSLIPGPYKESNLVGNPFTTHLNAGEVVTALGNNPTAIDATYAAIYGYDGDATTDASTWRVINSLSSTELITPGQGFIIISTVAGGTFTFPASAREVSATTQDDFIAGRQPNSGHSFFKLRLSKGTTNAEETSIYFVDTHGTRGLDVTYDAGSLGSDIGTHLVEDSQGINLAIQVLPETDLTASDYAIPVEVRVAAGQEATISISESNNIPAGVEFYLDDTELDVQTLITSNDYTFTPSSSLSGVGRFYLRTTSETFSTPYNALNAVEVYSIRSEKKLVVQGQLRNDSVLKIYDIRGRLIETHALEASQTKHKVDVSTISSGVYVVHLNNKSQSKTIKLVIN